jgi:hypothetical protein
VLDDLGEHQVVVTDINIVPGKNAAKARTQALGFEN